MIIDIHTHTFPDKIAAGAVSHLQQSSHIALFSDGTEGGLGRNEKRAGVDLAVVQPVATNPDKVTRMNDYVFQTNRRTAETGVLSFGAMHPAFQGWEGELERLKGENVKGVKLHPPYAGIPIDDPRAIAILKKCRELGLVVLIHSGKDVGLPGADQALPVHIRRALDAAGPVKLIAAHMAGWACWEEAERLLADTGIYLDTAFSLGRITPAPDGFPWEEKHLRMLDNAAACHLIRAFGPERVLFGTDSPWGDPAAEITKIKSLPLSQQEKEAILGENARRLLLGSSQVRSEE